MGEVLDMVTKKRRLFDCQGEGVVDLREHFANEADTPERRIGSAGALTRCVDEMLKDFGVKFTFECLTTQVLRVKGRK